MSKESYLKKAAFALALVASSCATSNGLESKLNDSNRLQPQFSQIHGVCYKIENEVLDYAEHLLEKKDELNRTRDVYHGKDLKLGWLGFPESGEGEYMGKLYPGFLIGDVKGELFDKGEYARGMRAILAQIDEITFYNGDLIIKYEFNREQILRIEYKFIEERGYVEISKDAISKEEFLGLRERIESLNEKLDNL